MKKLTAVSLFSGCGGFDLGAQRAGLKILWANDIDPAAEAAYRELLPRVAFKAGDVRSIKEFPRADVLIGCYPCTGFSLGALRRWHDRAGARELRSNSNNYLYREFLRALRQVQPKYFFVENVRGMIAAEDGWFLERQTENFSRYGYRVKTHVVDAKSYGVPQSRKRLFIVGVKREDDALKYSFPEPTHGEGGQPKLVTLRDVLADMDRWPTGEYFKFQFHGHYLTRQRKRGWDDQSFTIVANMHHVPLHPMGQAMRYVKKDTWELQGRANRRLSWREGAAIQGIPSEAVEAVLIRDEQFTTLNSRYRVVGNAVPPRLGEVLVGPVVRFEETRARAVK